MTSRYRFPRRDAAQLIAGIEGVMLPDVASADAQALPIARLAILKGRLSILKGRLRTSATDHWRCEIRDAKGHPLDVVTPDTARRLP